MRKYLNKVFQKKLPKKAGREGQAWRQNTLIRLSADLVAANGEAEICNSVVKSLHDSLGYAFIALFILDEITGNRTITASVGFKDPLTPLEPGKGLSERPIIDGKLQYTPNVKKHPKYFYGIGGSEVDLPIWIGDKVLGVLVVESQHVSAFDQEDFDLLTAAVHITGLAIEKARVLSEERQRSAELEALRATMTELTAELELPVLLQTIVERAATLLNATGGELGFYDEDRQEIRIAISHNLSGDHVGSVHNIGEGLMGKVAETREAIIIDDYISWQGKFPQYEDIHATLGVPLIVGNQLLGVFTTASIDENKKFDETDLHLLNLFAQQAAIAIENARLFDQTQKEIDERKKVQEEISRQKEYYQALLDNNPVAVVATDLNGDIVAWNPIAEKMFGYSFTEVVGNNLDTFIASNELIMEEALGYTKQAILKPVKSTTQRTHRDGTIIDIELLALPVIVGDEKIGFIAIYHDLTEIKRTERQLREQNKKMSRELELAGEIQASFLPRELPSINGWQFSTLLNPASETSGDFLDIRILPNGNILILIADVVDKGVGAALFMALAWTLLRVFSIDNQTSPEWVMREVNRRILEDTKSGQFLTVFYSVLDPRTGELIYSNAGHWPPYLFSKSNKKPQALIRTGMPVGVTQDSEWEKGVVNIAKGDVLVLYSDGVTEGQNEQESFYGEEKFIKVISQNIDKSADNLCAVVVGDLNRFVGEEPQSDDIALIIIKREDDN